MNITQQYKCEWTLNHVDLNFNVTLTVQVLDLWKLAVWTQERTVSSYNALFRANRKWSKSSHFSHCAQPTIFRDYITWWKNLPQTQHLSFSSALSHSKLSVSLSLVLDWRPLVDGVGLYIGVTFFFDIFSDFGTGFFVSMKLVKLSKN